jgi:hypothetical protein
LDANWIEITSLNFTSADDFQTSRNNCKEVVQAHSALSALLRDREAMEYSTYDFRSAWNRMNFEESDILFRVASAANTSLKMARYAGSCVEYRAEAITARHWVARCPVMHEQGQPSLLDRRTRLWGADDGYSRRQRPDEPRTRDRHQPQANPPTKPSQ